MRAKKKRKEGKPNSFHGPGCAGMAPGPLGAPPAGRPPSLEEILASHGPADASPEPERRPARVRKAVLAASLSGLGFALAFSELPRTSAFVGILFSSLSGGNIIPTCTYMIQQKGFDVALHGFSAAKETADKKSPQRY